MSDLSHEITNQHVQQIEHRLQILYAEHNADLPFHGWHHVRFVTAKSIMFANELGADPLLVEAAALVHDLNYIADPTSGAQGGTELRARILREVGLPNSSIALIEETVLQAETASRDANITREARALSDADTLFKALPITPVVLAPLYMRETKRSLRTLAEKIVGEQVPLMSDDIYFYSKSATEKYRSWGRANLALWRCILDSLDDPDVVRVLDDVEQIMNYAARTDDGE